MTALQEFQKKIGATPDGAFGKETLKKAKEFYKLSNEQTANLFGQVSHESGCFTTVYENLNYKVDTMLRVFKSDFDTNKDRVISDSERKKAESVYGQPIKVANFVYANQNGNGNEASGDGFAFRGRGFLQLTGRGNFKQFSDFMKDPEIMKNPDLVATKYAMESAIFFFTTRKLWDDALKIDDASIKKISITINGGTNGLEERILLTKRYYNLLIS